MNTKLSNVREQQTIDNAKKFDESVVQKQQFLDYSFQQQMQHFKEYGTITEDHIDRSKFHTSANELKEVNVDDTSSEKALLDFLSDIPESDTNVYKPIALENSPNPNKDKLVSQDEDIVNNKNNSNILETPIQNDTVAKISDSYVHTHSPSTTCSESSHITNETLMQKLLNDKIEGKLIGDTQDNSPISSQMDD